MRTLKFNKDFEARGLAISVKFHVKPIKWNQYPKSIHLPNERIISFRKVSVASSTAPAGFIIIYQSVIVMKDRLCLINVPVSLIFVSASWNISLQSLFGKLQYLAVYECWMDFCLFMKIGRKTSSRQIFGMQ